MSGNGRQWPSFAGTRRIGQAAGASLARAGPPAWQDGGSRLRLRDEAPLRTLTEDVVKSSEIEGEQLDARAGAFLDCATPRHRRRRASARRSQRRGHRRDHARRDLAATHSRSPRERLFDWHAALFPTGRSGMRRIKVGAWRDDTAGPMQVVSGPVGREKVHYEAPPAARVAKEMQAFLDGSEPGDADPAAHRRRSRICGSSPSTPSTTATAASRARSPTWRSRARRTALSASTACRRRSGTSATTYYAMLEARRRATPMSRDGKPGSSNACCARSKGRTARSAACSRGAILGALHEGAAQRTADQGSQSAARRLRGQAHVVEVGEAREELAGHRATATSRISSSVAR